MPQRLHPIRRDDHLEPLELEQLADHVSEGGIVFDDEDAAPVSPAGMIGTTISAITGDQGTTR